MSALAGGLTDLYVCDVASGRLQQLTDDPVRRSATGLVARRPHDRVCDRTLLERSDVVVVSAGRSSRCWMSRRRAVRNLSVSAGAAHLNPQWSPDDRDLYFVSDPDGTMNIYRAGTGSARRCIAMTNVDTGVSGITPTSPAFSIADDASALAFTIYDRGRPRLIVLDQHAGAGRRSHGRSRRPSHSDCSRRPAEPQAPSIRYLADLDTGVPDPSTIATRAYRLGACRSKGSGSRT